MAQCLGGHTALPRWETELSWLFSGQQRRLPCAKGAVGERRLRDWRRDDPVSGRPRGASAPGDRTRLNHSPGFAIPPCMALPCCPPFAHGGLFLWPSAWAVILSLPFFIQPAFSDAPGQDCTLAPTGVGLPAPEHPGQQRIPTGDRNGCGATPPGISSPFSGNTVCNKKREEQECREKWRSAASTHPNCRL